MADLTRFHDSNHVHAAEPAINGRSCVRAGAAEAGILEALWRPLAGSELAATPARRRSEPGTLRP